MLTQPGDPLYPVKIGWENLRLQLAVTDDARASASAELASRRTEEIAEMAAEGRSRYQEAVDRLSNHTADAVSRLQQEAPPEDLGQRMLEITQRQQQVLATVAASAPPAAQPALQHALEVARQGHSKAQAALERAQDRKNTPERGRENPQEQQADRRNR